MRLKTTMILLLVFVASLTLLAAGSACDLGDNGDGGAASEAMLNMMKRVPDDVAMFMFYDVEGIQAEDDWADMFGEEWDMSDAGIDVDTEDIEAFAMAMTEDFGTIILIEGNFDADEIGDALEDAGYDDATYNDVDIWVMEEYGFSEAVALLDGLLIAGTEDSVKDCIDVIEDGDDSLYDNEDFKDASDHIGDGLLAVLVGGEDVAGEYDGGEVMGMSFDAKDSDTAKVTGVMVFEDADAADDAMDEIEDDLKDEEEWDNFDIDQSGRIIEASGEVDIDDVGF